MGVVSIPNIPVLIGHNMEYKAYIDLLDANEEKFVEQQCGKKSKRNDGADYRRYKTRKRTVVTTYGTVTRYFVYIQHKETKECFSPLLNHLRIEKHQHASREFKEVCAKKASRNTYRDASIDFMDSNNVDISHTTIWTYAKEVCNGVECETEADENDRVLMADGTKANNKDGGKHEIRTVISVGDKTSLLSFTVNASWNDIAKNIDLKQFDVLVSDAEPGLYQAFNGLRFQLCHLHAIRDTGYYLWQDGLTKKNYDVYVEKLKTILYTLQNSTKKYWKDGDNARLIRRVEWTKSEVKKLIALLRRSGYHQAGNFLSRHVDHLTTAAEVAITKGIRVPWTTNQIERMMREVGKRTKKKGMCWSESGLMRVVVLNLKRYMVPFKQRKYLKLFGDNKCVGVEV